MRAKENARRVGLHDFVEKIGGPVHLLKEIRFEEVLVNTPGKLIVAVDSFISDAYFLQDYLKSEKTLKVITELSKNLTRFKYAVIRFDITNCSTT